MVPMKLMVRIIIFVGWSWECFLHWGQFYRLALAGLLMVCIEWWSFEIGTFLAGNKMKFMVLISF